MSLWSSGSSFTETWLEKRGMRTLVHNFISVHSNPSLLWWGYLGYRNEGPLNHGSHIRVKQKSSKGKVFFASHVTHGCMFMVKHHWIYYYRWSGSRLSHVSVHASFFLRRFGGKKEPGGPLNPPPPKKKRSFHGSDACVWRQKSEKQHSWHRAKCRL